MEINRRKKIYSDLSTESGHRNARRRKSIERRKKFIKKFFGRKPTSLGKSVAGAWAARGLRTRVVSDGQIIMARAREGKRERAIKR